MKKLSRCCRAMVIGGYCYMCQERCEHDAPLDIVKDFKPSLEDLLGVLMVAIGMIVIFFVLAMIGGAK